MTKTNSILTGALAACLACLSQTAWAQGWAGAVPPWRGPSAASRSTTPSNAAGPFNAYYPAYGSYPDPVERQWTASAQGPAAGYGGSAYSKYARNANRLVTDYAGETLYYGGESVMQPQGALPAEQVLPPGAVQPMQPMQPIPGPVETISPQGMPLQSAPAPMMMPGPCGPSDPCGATNPCCPPCPASWQHRCGQRMGDMLSKMRECCDKFCASIKNCCAKPQSQPCCWTGYQAGWHAPQPSNCMLNQCLPGDQMPCQQGGEGGEPLDMELSSGAEVISDGLSETYETVEPTMEAFDDGPSLMEYGRPVIEDSAFTRPAASPAPPVQTNYPPAAAPGRVEASGRVENETTDPAAAPTTEPATGPIEGESPDASTLELVPPVRDDATT